MRGHDRVRRRSPAAAFAGRPPWVTACTTSDLEVVRDAESGELVGQLETMRRVDHGAEDRHGEDAAELAARVHGRRCHSRSLRRDDREHRGGHGDEREPEPEADERERACERAERDVRLEQRVDAEHPAAREEAAERPSAPAALAPPSRRPPARPATTIATAIGDELERDLPAREARDDLEVERGEEEDGEQAEAGRERDRRSRSLNAGCRRNSSRSTGSAAAPLDQDERRRTRPPRSRTGASIHQVRKPGALALDHREGERA